MRYMMLFNSASLKGFRIYEKERNLCFRSVNYNFLLFSSVPVGFVIDCIENDTGEKSVIKMPLTKLGKLSKQQKKNLNCKMIGK